MIDVELGLRGAEVAANRVALGAALVLETVNATDSPDVQPKDRIITVGEAQRLE